MLRGAIIGLGNVALDGHLPGWRRCRDVEIVAATDVEPARRAAIEALIPTVEWCATAQALLVREQLDFVDICTPRPRTVRWWRPPFGRGGTFSVRSRWWSLAKS